MPSSEHLVGGPSRPKKSTRTRQSHPGNVPTIPQSEECNVCGAKFTRLSHLKRHQLTHNDSRPYECDKCSFTFTRRDLLTRHLRTCRKARECTACAEGKKECDLQRPCGACKAENRECVSTPNTHAKRPSRQDGHGRRSSASGITDTPSPAEDLPADGTVGANTSETSSLSPNSYLEIHPYSLVSDAMVASWPPYICCAAPDGSIGDEAEKYEVPTEWTSPTEVQYLRYNGLFFNEFLKHVPIIHPVLGRQQISEDDRLAAIACALGSLAADDVPSGYMCAVWMQAYKRVSTKVKAGVSSYMPDFLLEFCFLHAIQIFRSHPNHLLVTTRRVIEAIRRDSLISKLSTYPLAPPANISDDAMRAAWHQWIRYEMNKRILWLLFVIDTIRYVFFGDDPLLNVDEMILPLPCDDVLWETTEPVTWFMLFSNSWNVEGADHLGVFLFDALERLEREPLREVDFSSRGAMIVVIMTILRLLNQRYNNDAPAQLVHVPLLNGGVHPVDAVDNDTSFLRLRRQLSNWSAGWTRDTERRRKFVGDSHYLWNPLPCYLVALWSFTAYREGLAPFGPSSSRIRTADAMRRWIHRASNQSSGVDT